MQLALSQPRPRRISLTPLVDVVFILLFFFMLASRTEHWRSLPVNLQAAPIGGGQALASEKSESVDHDALVVMVSSQSIRTAQGDQLSVGELKARLRGDRNDSAGNARVIVVPVGGLSYQGLLDFTDTLSAIGVAVSFANLQPMMVSP